MEEIIKRYHELYEDMATSGIPEKMKVFGEAEKWAFAKMTEVSPKTAQCWLDKLESANWNNYLSKMEAENITAMLINQDGKKGAHWDYPTFKAAVESLGGKMSNPPYYNCYALWVTANMLYSDHHDSASMYVPEDDMPKYFYMQALEKLEDKDRTHFVREYFGV